MGITDPNGGRVHSWGPVLSGIPAWECLIRHLRWKRPVGSLMRRDAAEAYPGPRDNGHEGGARSGVWSALTARRAH